MQTVVITKSVVWALAVAVDRRRGRAGSRIKYRRVESEDAVIASRLKNSAQLLRWEGRRDRRSRSRPFGRRRNRRILSSSGGP